MAITNELYREVTVSALLVWLLSYLLLPQVIKGRSPGQIVLFSPRSRVELDQIYYIAKQPLQGILIKEKFSKIVLFLKPPFPYIRSSYI